MFFFTINPPVHPEMNDNNTNNINSDNSDTDSIIYLIDIEVITDLKDL